jgi:hypothetical protein
MHKGLWWRNFFESDKRKRAEEKEENIELDLSEICCEGGSWMELAQDRVQWQALVLAVLNLGVLLPES